MKLKRDEFIKLQKEWYRKLEESGFKDIEKIQGEELILVQSASYCYKRTNPLSRSLKEEYFRWIAQEAHDKDTVYRNEVDRYILIRHAEGARVKAIVEELELNNMARDRQSVRFIIRRYEMEWGLRHYDHKQLHIKKKA